MVIKKTKVSQEGSMFTHTNFCTSVCVHTNNNKKRGSCVLGPIYQTTYIQSEKFKEWTPTYMAMVNQILNDFGNGPKAKPPWRG